MSATKSIYRQTGKTKKSAGNANKRTAAPVFSRDPATLKCGKNTAPMAENGAAHMHHKLKIAAVSAVAALGTLGVGLTGTAAAYETFHVQGTGGNGVNVRGAPSLNALVDGTYPEGAPLTIGCQTTGDPVTVSGPEPGTTVTSNIWDAIGAFTTSTGPFSLQDTQGYVSDLYLDTPGVGSFSTSPDLPTCASLPLGGSQPSPTQGPSGGSAQGQPTQGSGSTQPKHRRHRHHHRARH